VRVAARTRGTHQPSNVLSDAVQAAQLDGRIRTPQEAGQWAQLTVTASSDVVPGLLAEIRALDPKRPPEQWRGKPRPAMAPVAASAASAPHSGASMTTSGIAPYVRTVAASLGVDLTRVTGTGVAGRVTVGDVRAAADPAFPALVAAAQQVEYDLRFTTDVDRWPTGSAVLDERIRTSPLKMYDVTAAVHRGPVTAAEPLLPQPKMPTVHFDGATPGGVGSVPPLPVLHDRALTAWRYGDADVDAAALAARPTMYYRPASGPPDGTE